MERFGVRSTASCRAWSRLIGLAAGGHAEERKRVERFKSMDPEKDCTAHGISGSDLLESDGARFSRRAK